MRSAASRPRQTVVRDGTPAILDALRRRHGFVGDASLQSDRYHCDAVVVADADVTRIPRQAVLGAMRSDAAFALRWIGMLNQEVRRLRQHCERLSLNTVRPALNGLHQRPSLVESLRQRWRSPNKPHAPTWPEDGGVALNLG